MDTPAVIRATYSDLKFLKTRKVAQIICEVPIENAGEIVKIFGAPDPSRETWVAVALLSTDNKGE